MTARSDNGTSETRDATTVVSVGKDGRIEILDAAVLDLIAGGLVKASPALRSRASLAADLRRLAEPFRMWPGLS